MNRTLGCEKMSNREPTLGRRVILKVSGAGLAVAALPVACTNPEFPYVPPEGGASEGDSGAPRPSGKDASATSMKDSQTSTQEDSAAQPPPTDSGTVGLTDTGTTGTPDSSSPPPTCTQNSDTLVFPISMYPALGSAGGTTGQLTDTRYVDPVCQGNDFYVVATGPGEFAAFSMSCTHECCTLNISGSSLTCPCHGATFDVATGMVTRSPAKKNLPSIPVCTDGTNVYVQLA
jgi:Rieske Fe-S protein